MNLRVGERGSQALVESVRALDALGVHTEGLGLRRPSLDDVFLSLTGHGADEDETPQAPARRAGGQRH